MEKVQIIGVDPSLRFTGIAKVTYNTETKKFDKPSCCQVIQNRTQLKGTDAILHMLHEIEDLCKEDCYQEFDKAIIESPVMPFNAKFQASSMISVAHITGGAISLFGSKNVKLYRPSEWNRSKKKEVTHRNVQEFLGHHSTWDWRVPARRKDHIEHVLDAVSMAYYYIQTNIIC